jgi:uncharacterized protein (TIGR02246 family)
MDAIERERELWALLARGDVDGFAGQLLPDAWSVDGAEIQTATELLEGLRSITLESFELTGVASARVAEGTEVVVYRVTETVVTPDGEMSRSAVATSTWVERDGVWRLALHHESPIRG